MKKHLSVLLAILMVFALIGCGSSDDKEPTVSNSDTSVFSKETVRYKAEDGSSIYKLIRAAGLMGDAPNAVQSLFTTLKKTADVTGLLNSVDENVEASSADFEILIGQTNRDESKTALKHLEQLNGGRKDDFIIATVGNKIVINAFNDASLVNAIEYFKANYIKESIDGGIYYTSLTEGDFAKVAVNGAALGNFHIIRPAVNFSYIAQMQIEALQITADSQYGTTLSSCDDSNANKYEYEIIVGSTDRDGVEAVADKDCYSIKISGKKVFLNGGSSGAVAMAVSEFSKLLQKGDITDSDSVSGSYTAAVAGYDASKYYTHVWGDDFDKADREVDPTLWYTVPEGEYSSKGHYDRTAVRTTDTNYVFVEDGKFVINCAYDDTRYFGGMLMTDRTMLFKYGYVEMSAILPNGNGLWTSLWLDSRWHYAPKTDSGINYDMEIDINECFGKANVVAANCHAWPTDIGEKEGYEHLSLDADYSNDKKHYSPEGETFNDRFHTFGMLWDEDEFSFTCDGNIYFTYKINTTLEELDAFHQLCYIRLSAAVGFKNNSLKVVADDSEVWYTTNKFIVDYVHLYQLADGVQQLVIRDGTLN